MGKASQTPVMRQYLAAKAEHPEALLLFRMGDFYELFFDDAVVAAKALDLTLTARSKDSDDPIPMAGVPHHAASGYVQRLLEQGFQVAICEQMADPSKVKGLVPRAVVRVVSPGIAYDDAGIASRQNHYLAAVERSDGALGVAALDLSTGELTACAPGDATAALAELVRLAPREVLVGAGAEDVTAALTGASLRMVVRQLPSPMSAREADLALDALLGAGEGAASCPDIAARAAAGRCVATARAYEAGRALPISRLTFYALSDTLALDESTQAHLELVRAVDGGDRGSLLAQIDATITPQGARLLRRRLLAPLTSIAEIRRRHDGVGLFVDNPGTRAELRRELAVVGDVERLAVKFALDRAAPRDLAALRGSLAALPALEATLARCPEHRAREALGAPESDAWLDPCSDLHELLASAVADDPPAKASDGGVIRDGHDPALDEARELMRSGQRIIVDLEARLREAAAIPSLKLRYTRVFGWYIEVTKTHLGKVPAAWRRKQTVAGAERFTCDELDAMADKLAHAEERAATREAELLVALVRAVARYAERLRAVSATVATWDVAAALAEVAHRHDWARPAVDDTTELELADARHPVVEQLAAAGRFVPNDVTLGAGEGRPRLWLVTGPNMAGKSTLMRQTALAVILAQMGSFVPASRARVGVVDRVLTRVGASDNLSRGESTFMVEMKETAHILRCATRRSLVVLDEIGRGTSTYDGLAIAWAVAEHLHDVIACRAMFATHYHELTELSASRSATCENWSVSAREHEGQLVFFHKLQRGAASQSYGVACARLAGVPEPVLARARALLGQLEQGGGRSEGGGPALARAEGRPQLSLFESTSTPSNPVLETLRHVDVNRLTPLDALQLVVKLQKMSSP